MRPVFNAEEGGSSRSPLLIGGVGIKQKTKPDPEMREMADGPSGASGLAGPRAERITTKRCATIPRIPTHSSSQCVSDVKRDQQRDTHNVFKNTLTILEREEIDSRFGATLIRFFSALKGVHPADVL